MTAGVLKQDPKIFFFSFSVHSQYRCFKFHFSSFLTVYLLFKCRFEAWQRDFFPKICILCVRVKTKWAFVWNFLCLALKTSLTIHRPSRHLTTQGKTTQLSPGRQERTSCASLHLIQSNEQVVEPFDAFPQKTGQRHFTALAVASLYIATSWQEVSKCCMSLIILSLHCHHQNDSCIKTGSDESHFNVSLVVIEGQSHKTVYTDYKILKREEGRSGIEPRPFHLPA